jgi:hypothetical protein
MNSRWLAFAQKARGQLEIEVAISPPFASFPSLFLFFLWLVTLPPVEL